MPRKLKPFRVPAHADQLEFFQATLERVKAETGCRDHAGALAALSGAVVVAWHVPSHPGE